MIRLVSFYIILAVIIMITGSLNSFAGEIKSINIEAKDGSQVNIKTNEKSKIKKIKVEKDKKSKVIINNKPVNDVNCGDGIKPDNKGICKP